METKKEEKKDEQAALEIIATPEQRIPKLCTTITFTTAGDDIIFTLLYDEKSTFKEAVVIERVMISKELAGKSVELLEKILKGEKL